jgi:hypothetical protein
LHLSGEEIFLSNLVTENLKNKKNKKNNTLLKKHNSLPLKDKWLFPKLAPLVWFSTEDTVR